MNKLNISGLIHLVIVYIVWGSTYLAIRVAVRSGSGFPPLIMSATRILVASVILFGMARLLKQQTIRLTKQDVGMLAISGIALWWSGYGLVATAEQTVGSGYAALVISSTPIWVAIIESVLDRKRPSLLLILSLFIGAAGIVALNWPAISTGNLGDLKGALMLIVASFSWGSGSIYQKRKNIQASPEVRSAVQQFFGGIALLLTSFAIGEPTINPIPSAWWSWGFLVIFGSVIAFTSFIKALTFLPPNVVFTYAFVNPVIAVILGFFILGEPITQWTLMGASLVIMGVFGVFKDQKESAPQLP
ncbi:MAG: EamA family transporter [Candidatus Marinimicrobia bacterium]|nr:EamA family transporter [Candidatus Neomarinimicrobiota bacterium]MBL7031047.1 EamA family transporter [Candidatus Neomarinimicrobiota bacterium]